MVGVALVLFSFIEEETFRPSWWGISGATGAEALIVTSVAKSGCLGRLGSGGDLGGGGGGGGAGGGTMGEEMEMVIGGTGPAGGWVGVGDSLHHLVPDTQSTCVKRMADPDHRISLCRILDLSSRMMLKHLSVPMNMVGLTAWIVDIAEI
ncbi:hypothetical protein BC936DRAFT_139733 [Jimgerdemannia flammicorona]|uniref:Uncharacterized protein n=1 Tax=Jimgerdemannia flammicorona TaxID=994334 RepID=A0A433DHL5_9FUNG|nr:hypothetical protein BC936DRAFT_139733 [Jimgerdemannia flammicorona]